MTNTCFTSISAFKQSDSDFNVFVPLQLIGTLEEIHMPQNGINHPGVTALAKALQHNTSLRILNLNDNTFTEKGAVAMAQVVHL